MTRTRAVAGAMVFAAFTWPLTACASTPRLDRSKPFADGVYEGTSGVDSDGGIGTVTLTVTAGQVSAAHFEIRQKDGTLKGQDYGKTSQGEIANADYYAKAQAAVASFEVYARGLITQGYPEDVDVVTGATRAHRQFVEASTDALTQSQTAAEQ